MLIALDDVESLCIASILRIILATFAAFVYWFNVKSMPVITFDGIQVIDEIGVEEFNSLKHIHRSGVVTLTIMP